MANVEEFTAKGLNFMLQKEVNQALSKFSAEEKNLESEVLANKDLKAWSKEEMKDSLDSGELKKRMDEYIQLNGEKIQISNIEMDKDLLKMKYKVKLGGEERDLTAYIQIMWETNNSYFQFMNNPKTNTENNTMEFFVDKDNTKKFLPEGWYRGGKMFDINIIKLPSKRIDIRIVENERKTKEKVLERIKIFELAPEFTEETFADESLENTRIETLKYTQLGKEITPEGNGYSRAIFMREGEKYKEIGKVYFNEKGELDTKQTKASQEFKLLGVTMKIAVNTTANTFNLENVDKLKEQIKKHREILSTYIENSEFGDNTIFTGFNRPKGGKRQQTKLLGLKLADDMYTFKRRGDKEEKTLNFWFTNTNELMLRDVAGKAVEPITIQIEKGNRKELRDITKDVNKKQLLIQKASKELTTDQEKPELKNAPVLLKDYLYNSDAGKIEYHNKKWSLLTEIPANKTEKNERNLEERKEDVKLDDLFKYLKTNMDKALRGRIKNINILENDMYGAFVDLRTKSKVNIVQRNVVRVLDNEKNGICKYYKVNQKNEWEPFVFEDDDELYEEAQDIMNEILKNIDIIEKIENTKLSYQDKKEKIEKPFTQFVSGCWLLPIDTKTKIAFLQETDKIKTPLTKTFIWGFKTENIQNFPVIFNITDKKITVNEKEQTINTMKYKTRLEDSNKWLKLRFDDVE